MTTFRWPNSLGNPKQVAIFGEFNNWEIPVPLNRSAETKDFFKSFALRPGLYEYKYVVDGEWCLSPCEPTTSTPDGQFNNRRLVTPSAVFHWAQGWGGKEVFLTGDFCGWGELLPLYPDKDAGGHTLACSLAPGVYNFLYLVDGKWMTAPDADVCPDCHGRLCNRKHVKAAAAFHVFYSTSWRHPILHYRCILEGSSSSSDNPKEGWAKTRMVPAPCRQPESSSRWMTAVVPAPTNNESRGSQQLEFFIEDKESKKRDLAPGGSNYACQAPGGFKLSRGKLLPFARVTRPPVMVVSDLDGTMVGDSNSAERSTQAFCNYWENNAALAGSVLVYNTGRSLGQFVGLWQHKNGALALPDVVICAVGTKICMLGDGKTRATATGHKWREDMSWRRILDYGWDLGKVRRVVESAMHRYHDVNWLDNGSEHPHRCSVSCSASVVDELAKRLKSGFDKEGVQVKVIVSGYGDWRYVDCVATRAGKQEALEYVRTLYGIPRDQCIAFGDSGNDTLMLEGKHPAVIVGNSQPTLVDWYSKQSVPDTGRERVIFADGNYAWGILEGLARHGLY